MPADPLPAHHLVLCADDYGMNAGIDSAVLDLARHGRLSATSCMTNAPGWPEAARRLREVTGLGVGLHLTLTWGRPLGPMRFFARDGAMPDLGSVMRRSLLGGLPLPEIEAEIDRQLDSFEAAFGRRPDFVDGHQHVHVLPGVRAALLSRLVRRGLSGRVWLRDPSDRSGAVLARRLSAAKALLVGALSSGFAHAVRSAGFRTNVGFSGFSPFDPHRDPGRDMAGFLDNLGPAPLAMCHPGRDAVDADDTIAAARIREYDYLRSDGFGDLLREKRVTLVPSPAPVRT